MQVVYTAPNRSSHFHYAKAFYQANCLAAFVSGFSRFSPHNYLIQIGDKLRRADLMQNIYLAALKFKLPVTVTDELAYLAKMHQDRACKKFMKKADVFLFYNGSGLSTASYAKKKGALTIVEAVNSHVDFQETILRQEYEELNLPWRPFHKKEKQRRIMEYETADYIMVPSHFSKRTFLQYGFAEEKLLYVPYGFPSFNATVNNDSKKGEPFTVLYVGTVSVRKGLRYLIEAFNKLSVTHKKLVITGPISEHNGIETHLADSNIVFTGVLKGKDLEDVYAHADVLCLPSIEDGFGLVLGEALSFGLAIIGTENTGTPDVITDGEEGFVVPIKSSEAIQEKLELLATDENTLLRMKNKARKKATTLNGWDEVQRHLVNTVQRAYEQHTSLQ